MFDVFISYSSPNTEAAQEVCSILRMLQQRRSYAARGWFRLRVVDHDFIFVLYVTRLNG